MRYALLAACACLGLSAASAADGSADQALLNKHALEMSITAQRMGALMQACAGPSYRYSQPSVSAAQPGVIEIAHMRPAGHWGEVGYESVFVIAELVDDQRIEFGDSGPCGWVVRFFCATGTKCIGDLSDVMLYRADPEKYAARNARASQPIRSSLYFVFGAASRDAADQVTILFDKMVWLSRMTTARQVRESGLFD